MKKYILLLLLLFPFVVNAESYTIRTKVSVEGKQLEEGEFLFNLIDKDGNIVQTRKNDKDGNVIFDAIEWNDNGVETHKYTRDGEYTYHNLFHVYKIQQLQPKNAGYTIDNEITYVLVSDEGSRVKYLKYPSEEKIKNFNPRYEWSPYHAKEEDLVGTVYLENDLDTKIVRIFRDEDGKYTNNQRIGNKVYSIYDENLMTGNSNPIYQHLSDDTESNDCFYYVKKIIIEDPIRPVDGNYLFGSLERVEEIVGIEKLDTSKMTDMYGMFSYMYAIKEIDVTHFDFSNVTGLQCMFQWSSTIPTDINIPDVCDIKIAKINTTKYHTNYSYMFEYRKNLRTNYDWIIGLGHLLDDEGYLYNSNMLRGIIVYTNEKYYDLSNFKVKIHKSKQNRNPLYGTNSYESEYITTRGLPEFIAYNSPYYVDISGIEAEPCSYNSNDIFFKQDDFRILKIGDKNGIDRGFVSSDSNQIPFYYNVDHNIMSDEIVSFGASYNYMHNLDDGSCKNIYYHGGTWLNIADDSTKYLNKYSKPKVKGIEEIIENPKTGVIRYTIYIVSLLIVCMYFYSKTRKKTYFRNQR